MNGVVDNDNEMMNSILQSLVICWGGLCPLCKI